MSQTKIVVLDGYTLNPGDNPWSPVEALGDLTVYDRTPADKVLERAKDADIVLTNKTPLPGEIIENLSDLKLTGVLATGYNIVDIAAASRRGIPVVNVPEYSTDTVAQFVFALLLELCHRVGRHSESVLAGDWFRSEDFMFTLSPQVELAGLTLGIVGYGRIGARVAQIADAFGMKVRATTRSPKPDPALADFAWVSLDQLLAESDVVSLHCPQTDQTTGMVNEAFFKQMKPSAFLINTSRGGLVNEADLVKALHSGQLAGAALDVVDSEPMPAGSVLIGAPNLIITPHIAWSALSARQRLMQTTAENIQAFLTGQPQNVVNLQELESIKRSVAL